MSHKYRIFSSKHPRHLFDVETLRGGAYYSVASLLEGGAYYSLKLSNFISVYWHTDSLLTYQFLSDSEMMRRLLETWRLQEEMR